MTQPTAPETERRSLPRRAMLKRGHIVFNGTRSTIDCTVRNLTDKGAKLQVASVLGIPGEFELKLPDASRRPCQVVWRRATELGVEFETLH